MKTHLSHTFLSAVMRLADGPLSRIQHRAATGADIQPLPDHILMRLENVFEELSELSSQPHIAAAFDLACDTLQAELPTEALAAGLYDIDADEIRILAARGVERDLLRGTVMPRARCLVGHAGEEAIITRGGAEGADWLGSGDEGSPVLLCPIFHDGNLLGVLALAEPLCAADFSHHDLELVAYVAGQLAGFIQAHRHRPT